MLHKTIYIYIKLSRVIRGGTLYHLMARSRLRVAGSSRDHLLEHIIPVQYEPISCRLRW